MAEFIELVEGTSFTPNFVTDTNENEVEIRENKILIELNNDENSKGSIYFDFVKTEGEDPKRFQVGAGVYNEETYAITEEKYKNYLELTKLAPSVSFMQKALDTTINEINNMFNQSFLFQNHGIGGLGVDSNNDIVNGAEIFNDYENNKALGQYSHAQGFNTRAFGGYSHAEGYNTKTDIVYSGYKINSKFGVSASGEDSPYLGFLLDNIKYENHLDTLFNDEDIEWFICTAQGERYRDEIFTKVKFYNFDKNLVVYDEKYFHSDYTDLSFEGLYLVCLASNAGLNSTTIMSPIKNDATHVEGIGTIGSSTAQHVQGKYNIPKENLAFIIGNGETEGKRSNAFAVDWNGNAYIEGGIIYGKANGNLQLIGRSSDVLGSAGTIEFNHLMSNGVKKVMAFLDYENNGDNSIATFYPGTFYKTAANGDTNASPKLANLGSSNYKWDNIYTRNLYVTNIDMPSGSSIRLAGGRIDADALGIKKLTISETGFDRSFTKEFGTNFINNEENSSINLDIDFSHIANFKYHNIKITNNFTLKLANVITYKGMYTGNTPHRYLYENKTSLYPYNNNRVENTSSQYEHSLNEIFELGTLSCPWNRAYINQIYPTTSVIAKLGSSDSHWNEAYINNIEANIIAPQYSSSGSLGIFEDGSDSNKWWEKAAIKYIHTNRILPLIFSDGQGTQLGNAQHQWSSGYIKNLTSYNLLPASDTGTNIGTFDAPWVNCIAGSMFAISVNALRGNGDLHLGTSSTYTSNVLIGHPGSTTTLRGTIKFDLDPSGNTTYILSVDDSGYVKASVSQS